MLGLILTKVLPLLNPALIGGLLVNNAQDGVIEQVSGITDTQMLIAIIVISLVNLIKNRLGK